MNRSRISQELEIVREIMKKLAVVMVIWLIMAVAIGAMGCSGKTSPTPTPEPTIPPDFTTYTDDAGIFSISYPQDWEAPLWMLTDLEQSAEDYVSSVNSDLSVENSHILFFAGRPIGNYWNPNINIGVEPKPSGLWTLDKVLEGEIKGIKSVITDSQELSRVKTTVGGKEAVILEWEGTIPNMGKVHDLQMFLLKGKTIWSLTCTATPENYGDSEDTFYDILHSFRILK